MTKAIPCVRPKPPSPPPACAAPANPLRSARWCAKIRSAAADLIWPVFVRDGDGIEEPVPSMPGVLRRSVDKVVEAAREAA